MAIKLTKSGPRIEEATVLRFESELGTHLPGDYRAFLLQHNGGVPETNDFDLPSGGGSGVNLFYGLSGLTDPVQPSDLRAERKRMVGRVPGHILPIGDAEGGNLVCISLSGQDRGAVYFWDHEEEAEEEESPSYQNLFKLADNFSDFWKNLREFDSTKVDVKPEQVLESWIDPDFLKQLKGK